MQFSETRKSRDLLEQHFKRKSNFWLIYEPGLEIIITTTYTDFVNSLSLISVYLLFRHTYKFLSNLLEKKPFPQLTFFFLKIYFPFQLMKIFQVSAFWSSGNIFKTPTIFFCGWKKKILFPQRSSSFLILKFQIADLQIIHSYRKPEIMVTALQPQWCQVWCQGHH